VNPRDSLDSLAKRKMRPGHPACRLFTTAIPRVYTIFTEERGQVSLRSMFC